MFLCISKLNCLEKNHSASFEKQLSKSLLNIEIVSHYVWLSNPVTSLEYKSIALPKHHVDNIFIICHFIYSFEIVK